MLAASPSFRLPLCSLMCLTSEASALNMLRRLSAAHTPDNSFLGFVVEQHLNASDIKHIDDIKRQNQSLVYGKVDNFWKVRQNNQQQTNGFKCQTLCGNLLVA